MGVFSGLVRFGKGGVLGAAIGAAAGLLLAPGSGKETRSAMSERIQRTRLAGVDAKADVEQDLIQRFRGKVSDTSALSEEEFRSKNDHVAAIAHVQTTKPEF
ncbi:MAG: YtxH domain-containing protein [Thermomicrobiales bacterium]